MKLSLRCVIKQDTNLGNNTADIIANRTCEALQLDHIKTLSQKCLLSMIEIRPLYYSSKLVSEAFVKRKKEMHRW
jgi:hypothetical protein